MAPDPVGCFNSGQNRVPLPRKTRAPRQLTTEQRKIVQIGTEVAKHIIYSHVSGQRKPCSKTALRMLQLVEEIETQNALVFDHMCSDLNLTTQNARTVFFKIGGEIFHGSINFGRIVTLYAFAGKMAQYFAARGSEEMAQNIISWVELQMETLSVWMQANDGWDGFEKHFEGNPSRWTPTTKSFLLAAVCGIGVAGCLLVKMT